MDDDEREIAIDEVSDWNSDDSDDGKVEWHLGQINVEEEEDSSGEECEDLLEEERRFAQRGRRRGREGGRGARGCFPLHDLVCELHSITEKHILT